MSSDPVISLEQIGKCYGFYEKPSHRLLQMFSRGRKVYGRQFWALRDVSLTVSAGEVVGLIGRNGAGKSTLLQLACGTLTPSSGIIEVRGRVAALLELGAGFNPEFTGRENVFLSASVIGMSHEEIIERYEEIVAFSGIESFIDQPVKTYSSGMYVRLAFSVAINVDPDILVIDEALSVGDGEFSRKSFDRIMQMKAAGKTILFCSHALYQVEAICNRVLWLHEGRVRHQGEPSEVIMAYADYLNSPPPEKSSPKPERGEDFLAEDQAESFEPEVFGTARLNAIHAWVDDLPGKAFKIISGRSALRLNVEFKADEALPMPHVAICFVRQDGQIIASVGTHFDDIERQITPQGGSTEIEFPDLPFLRGQYHIDIYLMCERGIHVYDCAKMVLQLEVKQESQEVGFVTIPHRWKKPES